MQWVAREGALAAKTEHKPNVRQSASTRGLDMSLAREEQSLLCSILEDAVQVGDVCCVDATVAYGYAAGVDIHDINDMRRLQELDESIRRERTIAHRYEVVRLLKYAGRSVVYKVRDKRSGECLALKMAIMNEPSQLLRKTPLSFLRRLIGVAAQFVK